MGQRDLLLTIVRALSTFQVPYLLTGSFAVSFYGFPRATHDIDFVIEIDKPNLSRLACALRSLIPALSFSPKDFEELSDLGIASVYHKEEATKIDFWLNESKDFTRQYSRRTRVRFDTVFITLASAEDIVLTKLAWCKEVLSERHMRDCIGIWHVQKGKLDEKYLYQRAKQLHISDLLKSVTKSKPVSY